MEEEAGRWLARWGRGGRGLAGQHGGEACGGGLGGEGQPLPRLQVVHIDRAVFGEGVSARRRGVRFDVFRLEGGKDCGLGLLLHLLIDLRLGLGGLGMRALDHLLGVRMGRRGALASGRGGGGALAWEAVGGLLGCWGAWEERWCFCWLLFRW